jgi:hypothetical protein
MKELPKYEEDVAFTLKNIKDLEFRNGSLSIKNEPQASKELQSVFDKAPTASDVTADQFLTKYQDFRDARYDLLKRAKKAETAEERQALFKAYEESKPIEASVSKALQEGLGEHSAEFKRLNEGYSTQVYPLRGNKIIQKAIKGKLGPNALEDIVGSGKGEELLKDIIKQDPELLRNIIGQRYAKKPENLFEIDEHVAEFINEMPELKKIIAQQEQSMNTQIARLSHQKNMKTISLKKKMALEKETKTLKDQLKIIKRDRIKIAKTAKTIGKVGVGLAIGSPIIEKMLNQYLKP